MAPIPIFGEHLLHGSVDHAVNGVKELLNLKDTASGWGGWVWDHLTQAYSNRASPEPQLFEDANIHEIDEWAKSTESLSTVDTLSTEDSWFEGDSWPSEDTFTSAESLVEFEDTGDGIVDDTPNLATPQAEWWDLPRGGRPKNPMPQYYQKSSSSVMTGPPEVMVDIRTARDNSVIVPHLRTRPDPTTYTTYDFGIWPWGTIVPPAQNDPKRVVQGYDEEDWFLTKRWGKKNIHEIYYM